MFFSHILCFNSNYVDKIASFHAVAMATARIIVREPVRAGKCQAERGWRAQSAFSLQPGMALHHILQPQVCPRPPFCAPRWECGNAAISKSCPGWLSSEENFLGHELESESNEDLCTSPTALEMLSISPVVTPCAPALPQRQARCSEEVG